MPYFPGSIEENIFDTISGLFSDDGYGSLGIDSLEPLACQMAQQAIIQLTGEQDDRPEIPVHPVQRAFCDSTALFREFTGGRGGGKALALDTLLPTPSGWTTIGEVQVGNQLFDERGVPCRVVAATDVMRGRPCFRVTFSDGASVIADAEHEWLTWDHAARKSLGRLGAKRRLPRDVPTKWRDLPQCQQRCLPRVVTTREIQRTLLYCGREKNHSVANCAPLVCPEIDLPIKPYTMGVWLGDGTSAVANITTPDPEVVEAVAADGYEIHKLACDQGKASRYRFSAPGSGLRNNPVNGQFYAPEINVLSRLRSLGITGKGNKRIPRRYLRASQHQRLELLRGLMDTDGYASNGRCEFTTVLHGLGKDMLELLVSLGIKAAMSVGRAKLNGKDCGPKYRIHFTPYVPVFKLPRKLANQGQPGNQYQRQLRRYIASVEPVESVPVRCVQVDSPSHLYLATRSMIPTHNSTLVG